MPYVTKADMLALVPADVMTVALDDHNYGADTENVWDVIASAADRRIDGLLGGRYPVPFADPAPALVREAAAVFAAHMLYLRRQSGESNPWAKEAAAMMDRLQKVADGLLDLTTDGGDADATAITEECKTYPSSGRLML
jgi:phage gp36-like protein